MNCRSPPLGFRPHRIAWASRVPRISCPSSSSCPSRSSLAPRKPVQTVQSGKSPRSGPPPRFHGAPPARVNLAKGRPSHRQRFPCRSSANSVLSPTADKSGTGLAIMWNSDPACNGFRSISARRSKLAAESVAWHFHSQARVLSRGDCAGLE